MANYKGYQSLPAGEQDRKYQDILHEVALSVCEGTNFKMREDGTIEGDNKSGVLSDAIVDALYNDISGEEEDYLKWYARERMHYEDYDTNYIDATLKTFRTKMFRETESKQETSLADGMKLPMTLDEQVLKDPAKRKEWTKSTVEYLLKSGQNPKSVGKIFSSLSFMISEHAENLQDRLMNRGWNYFEHVANGDIPTKSIITVDAANILSYNKKIRAPFEEGVKLFTNAISAHSNAYRIKKAFQEVEKTAIRHAKSLSAGR